jgi:hypothetical protein
MTLAVLVASVAGLTESVALSTAVVVASVASLAVSTNSDAGRKCIIHDSLSEKKREVGNAKIKKFARAFGRPG